MTQIGVKNGHHQQELNAESHSHLADDEAEYKERIHSRSPKKMTA